MCKSEYKQNDIDMRLYIVPECKENSVILKAFKFVRDFGETILFGKAE